VASSALRSQSRSSQAASSTTVNVVVVLLVLLCSGAGCLLYYFLSKRDAVEKDDGGDIASRLGSLFSRGDPSALSHSHNLSLPVSSYQPSLYQAATHSHVLRKTEAVPAILPQSGECVICSAYSSSVVALPCAHAICVEDLRSYLLASLADASLFPLRCPMHCQGCEAKIPTPLARQFLSREDHERYLDFHDRAVHGEGVRCIRCSSYIPLPDSRVNKIYLVACPDCTLVFCSQCKSLSHNGKRCPVDVDMEQFERWGRRAGAMKCPACSRWIEKEDPSTCNHMCHKATDPIPCVRERTDFCCRPPCLPLSPLSSAHSFLCRLLW
jgi:hypothetical protein